MPLDELVLAALLNFQLNGYEVARSDSRDPLPVPVGFRRWHVYDLLVKRSGVVDKAGANLGDIGVILGDGSVSVGVEKVYARQFIKVEKLGFALRGAEALGAEESGSEQVIGVPAGGPLFEEVPNLGGNVHSDGVDDRELGHSVSPFDASVRHVSTIQTGIHGHDGTIDT